MDITNKSILITGGTGSFGKKFLEMIVKDHSSIKRLVIFSRDELKQFELAQRYPKDKYPFIRFFLGDVRDVNRLRRAFYDIDIVIHAAALKQVPAAEYNPMEFINTNINGAQNVIEAALDCGVKKVVALSTDKAVAPINLYGATKLCSDKLFVAANNFAGTSRIQFSVVRYGNVMGSRGSVVPFFMQKKKEGELPITHKEMTRFNISLEDGAKLVFLAIEKAIGGEIFVPKIPSFKIEELARAVCDKCKFVYVGMRPGEKLHEEMITESDSYNTIEFGNYYAILPYSASKDEFMIHYNAKSVKPGFTYNSGTNSEWLSSEQLKKLIPKHIEE